MAVEGGAPGIRGQGTVPAGAHRFCLHSCVGVGVGVGVCMCMYYGSRECQRCLVMDGHANTGTPSRLQPSNPRRCTLARPRPRPPAHARPLEIRDTYMLGTGGPGLFGTLAGRE